MLYVDYTFDIEENCIMLDPDMHLGDVEGKGWGKLPESWKEGDTFQLRKSFTGRIMLVKVLEDK